MSDSEPEGVVNEEQLPAHNVRFSDMSEKLQYKAIKLVNDVFKPEKRLMGEGQEAVIIEPPSSEKDIATAIKKKLDQDPDLKDGCAGWHVIIGKSFASSLTYQTKHVIFFDFLEQNTTYLLFKTQ